MASFKDTDGRTWTLRINIDSLRRLRADLNINLVGEGLAEALTRIENDPILFADVLFALLREDAAAQNVTADQFGAALAGDAISEAADAFMDELTLFTPNPRSRARVQTLVKAAKQIGREAQDEADKAMPQVIADLRKSLTPGSTSGDLPAPLASIPAP